MMQKTLLTVVTLCLAGVVSALAEGEIGKITRFDGKAKILSGTRVVDVKEVGQPVLNGDKIQTEDGSVDVGFADGAQLQIKPFSTITVDEKTIEKGILFFKTKQDTRRVTANVGKAHFKSGEVSEKKNYLQTPTAVCAPTSSFERWGRTASAAARIRRAPETER